MADFTSQKLIYNTIMSQGWDDHEPAPCEFFHGRIMDEFHKWRKEHTDEGVVPMDGITLNNIIARAKTLTYEKYPKQNLKQAILKTDM